MTFYVKVFNHVIGKKYLSSVPTWLPSLVSYGAAASFMFVYIIDLHAVMGRIPFYRDGLRFVYEDDKRVYVRPTQELNL